MIRIIGYLYHRERASFGKKLTRDGLLKHFQEYYRDKYYPESVIK